MSQQQSQEHPHDIMDVDQGQSHRAQTLYALTTGSLASSVSKLSGSFRGLPSDKDFHFYYNFADFKIPIQEISKKSQSMLEAIGLSTVPLWGAKDMAFPASGDMDDGYDWLVNMNDELLERFDVSADEFQKVRKKEEETGQAETNMEDGFQLVYGRKKGGNHGSASQSSVGAEASVVTGVKVATKDKKTMGPKPKVPFHIPSIRKPQEEFSILVNNTNQPFEHVWLQRSEDGLRFIHPLEKHLVLDFVDEDIENLNPIKPPLLESAPFKLVEELKDLKELAAKLRGVQEFAVDLEHNQYRSFQGLTCLMQISTRTEDFVVDTLKLRVHVGPYLREVFKDPSKKKVMHGADRDIVWLQRDFGIYVCNLFDTGQASKVLKLERNSLEFLLHHFCGVTANKEYQNADWRLRPLPEEMLRYAREDTHYLLYIYDLMRIKLFSMPKESENCDAPLLEVYKRSYDVCMQLYEKELLTEDSYLYIYGLQAATLDASQLAVAAGLCQWRDVVARTEDESTGYVLPNKILLEIAKQKPDSISKLRRLVKSKHPFVELNLASIVSIIRHSIENAAEFESVAEQLKIGRIGMVAEENIVVTDGSEVFLPYTSTEAEVANARRESTDGSDAISGHVSLLFTDSSKPKPYSLETGSTASEQCSELPCSSITPSEQSRDADDNTLQLNSTKVTGATVQMLKKPSRAFGALLGSSAPKRKFGTDQKEEMKLEQIRCSVNLPFHSFSGRSEQSKPVTGVPDTAAKIGDPQRSVSMPAASSKMDDIILLENNSNAEEPEPGNSEATEEHKNNAGMSALESDNEDEPMTLSELSSSFEKCFGSLNQKGEARQAEKSQVYGFLRVKPFDYDAARKQVRFGEEEQSGSGSGEKGLRNTNDCRGKKKGPATGRGQRDDGTSEQLPQGRRRQAFPATGNRSATFRGV